MSGTEAVEALRRICRDLDAGLAPARVLARRVILPVPLAVGLSLGAAGCVTDERDVEDGCVDGEDNDGDGDVDCADVDCEQELHCMPQPAYGVSFEDDCDNGADDDGDNRIDCDDDDCFTDPACEAVAEYAAPFP
jgi:hypothetical protein